MQLRNLVVQLENYGPGSCASRIHQILCYSTRRGKSFAKPVLPLALECLELPTRVLLEAANHIRQPFSKFSS
ncbi:hypothetical protein BaRGS_00003942 [Batillaria attramentaria]|uniref:Uncharacterized protein n=1 Tax=Batillaria attramentaria TaxID=370345 RepID=A0ABD0LZL2_9CAEN